MTTKHGNDKREQKNLRFSQESIKENLQFICKWLWNFKHIMGNETLIQTGNASENIKDT